MNRNVGASFGLSVLTVLTFAVVLYQPDGPPPRAEAAEKAEPATHVPAEVVEAKALPALTSGSPIAAGNAHPIASHPLPETRPVAPVVSRAAARVLSPTTPPIRSISEVRPD